MCVCVLFLTQQHLPLSHSLSLSPSVDRKVSYHDMLKTMTPPFRRRTKHRRVGGSDGVYLLAVPLSVLIGRNWPGELLMS